MRHAFADVFEPQAGLKTNYRATGRVSRPAVRLWHGRLEDHQCSRRAGAASPILPQSTNGPPRITAQLQCLPVLRAVHQKASLQLVDERPSERASRRT